jgi:hypothetical protein
LRTLGPKDPQEESSVEGGVNNRWKLQLSKPPLVVGGVNYSSHPSEVEKFKEFAEKMKSWRVISMQVD